MSVFRATETFQKFIFFLFKRQGDILAVTIYFQKSILNNIETVYVILLYIM